MEVRMGTRARDSSISIFLKILKMAIQQEEEEHKAVERWSWRWMDNQMKALVFLTA